MKPRVLLVEDDLDLLKLLSMALEKAGFAVSAASRVRDANALPGPFAAMVLDCRLPDGHGRDVAAHRPGTPRLYISGAEPCDLLKPFLSFELVDAIHRIAGVPA